MKRRAPLFNPERLENLGPSKKTAGNTWFFRDDAGEEYVAKHSDGDFPFAVLNKWVSARLAEAAGIPLPPFDLVRHDGQPWFFSKRLDLKNGTEVGSDAYATESFSRGLGDILAFDLWVMNRDRHLNNFLVREKEEGLSPVAFDHDRAILSKALALPALEVTHSMDAVYLIHRSFRRLLSKGKLVLGPSCVSQSISRVKVVRPGAIREIVADARELASPEVLEAVACVLCDRRDRIDSIFHRITSHHELSRAFATDRPGA